MEIECERGREILVLVARYGRTSETVCNEDNDHNDPRNHIRECNNAIAGHIAITACSGKRSCSLSATESVFGNPCVGVRKYLEVEYICRRAA